jgi:hypothetical protein
MGILIYINKVADQKDNTEVPYSFNTPEGDVGKVSISKKNKEFFIIEEPEWDIEHKLAHRVVKKLIQHWNKGEFPDETCWAS